MRTALPANARIWPNVVSMLVQRRWRWANIETALGQILAFAGLHTGGCLHPPLPTIIFSSADQGTFSKTAGQSQAYYNTWNWERGTYDVNHLHILTCEIAVSRVSSVSRLMYRFTLEVSLHGCFLYCTWLVPLNCLLSCFIKERYDSGSTGCSHTASAACSTLTRIRSVLKL